MTPNELRSVSGYAGVMIAPIEDGDVSAADLRHVCWLFAQCFPSAIELIEFTLTVALEIAETLGVTPDVEVAAEAASGLDFTMEVI